VSNPLDEMSGEQLYNYIHTAFTEAPQYAAFPCPGRMWQVFEKQPFGRRDVINKSMAELREIALNLDEHIYGHNLSTATIVGLYGSPIEAEADLHHLKEKPVRLAV
jgi:hypothetical protein